MTTTAEFADIAASRRGLLRFHLAVQRTRAILFLVTAIIFVIGRAGRLITAPLVPYLAFTLFTCASAFFFSLWYKRRFKRGEELDLQHYWLPLDVGIALASVHLTGGIESPWWIFFLSNSSTAAFVSGKRAAWLVSLGNVIGYILLLAVTGEITGVNETFWLPTFRIAFLYASSFFLLTGIATIQEKRALIQDLRDEERHQIEELQRLTQELDRKSRELGEANRMIREADRAKSQFLANMSHELRTPMNSIIGFSEILAERLSEQISVRYLEFINHINASGQHLLSIINDILDLSKIEAGKMEIFPEKFSASDVAMSICHVLKNQTDKNGLSIECKIPRDLPQIESDLSKFKQVLYNLLSNAIKFSPRGSTITVEGRHDAERGALVFAVVDRGIGIAPENHEVIFQEFRQVDNSVRREYGGTGLGLALVKKMVELQGGSVHVESEIGKGSRFEVLLPITFEGDRSTIRLFEEENAEQSEGDRVLVVEDDARAFESLRGHLQSAGYVAINARHGDEALRLAKSTRPVAITLDLVLPGMDGWEILKRLKSDVETAEIPVVIISMVDQRELGFALGAHDYFLKPVERSQLVERIRQFTGPGTSLRPRLLVIDDDPAFHAMIDEELSRLGYQLSQAFDGKSGIELARRECPDVIVLDLMMPGMSGFEVAEALKGFEETVHIPIIVMTSKELTADDRAQLQSKITGLIPKGQSKARLLAAIQQVERTHRGVRSA